MSHPAWVCGLKLLTKDLYPIRSPSHPAWVCGLKPWFADLYYTVTMSHPAWVCGLKHPQKAKAILHPCHTLRGCVD